MEQESLQQASKKNTKKILLVAGLVLICVTALTWLGFTWQSQSNKHKDDITLRDQEISELREQIESLQRGELEDTNVIDETGYITAKEWGVELQSTPTGLSYIIKTGDDGIESLYVTNNKAQSLFEKAEGSCANKDEHGINHFYLAALSRYTTKQDEGNIMSSFIGHIGNHYYYYGAGNGTCTVGEDVHLESEARQELISAVQSVRAVE